MMSATDDLLDKRSALASLNSDAQGEIVEIIDDVHRRIGQELHDGVEQELVGLGMISQALLSKLQVDGGAFTPESLRSYQELAQRLVDGFSRAHEDLQAISRGLIPTNGFYENLGLSLEALAHRTNEIQGIACLYRGKGDSSALSPKDALQLYRIAQEALCNALKHSGASRIQISLECNEGGTVVQVADNGKGFGRESVKHGLGLESMQYRSNLIGAKLEITTMPTGGTLVICTLEGKPHE